MKREQIAVYIRLSKPTEGWSEDDKYIEESSSITMQRMLLKKYVLENFVDYDLLEFCDDGYTGTNFERPAVQRMLEMVRNSEINCIVVKDFSRFTRDYIELGSYLEQIFPFLGVRFISVNDNYDSKNYQGSIGELDVNFKNLLYDLYSKDLSQKVCSSLAVRKEQGQYVSANSPFGYEKDPKDRHALLIAEDEAEIVRRIFSLTLEGCTAIEIARLFNETGVKTPIEFKIEKGKTNRIPKSGKFLWISVTICQILRNEIYIGNVVQKKYTKDFVGGKNHLNPRESWLVSYNHHEPIINKDVFDEVQEGRGKKKTPQYNKSHMLTGKLVCGCCKKNLRYKRSMNPYFLCQERYSNAMEGCVNKVNAMFMEEYVQFMIQERLSAEGEQKKLLTEMAAEINGKIKELKEKQGILKEKIQKLKHEKFEAYQNYVLGKSECWQNNERSIEAAEKELEKLNEGLQEQEKIYFEMGYNRQEGKTENVFAVLSKEIIDKYIKKIIVYDEQNIEICWKEDKRGK